MGNENSYKSSFEKNSWRKIESKGFRSILYNDITMKSVEEHVAILDLSEEEAVSLCKWRQSIPRQSCIVELYEYGIKDVGMCSDQAELYVITERLHLLQDIGMISKAEAFLILKDTAQALRILFKKFGKFTPRPNTIGINSQGKAKSWINENFAVFEPERDEIPAEVSELGVMNNLIRILDSKVYYNDRFPIDYPRNLDFKAVFFYVSNVFANLQGFKVDRVYLDRIEFEKKYHEHRQFEENQIKSKIVAEEAERRYRQIQMLHENLRIQQLNLANKQREIQIQAQIQRQIAEQSQMLNLMQMQAQRPAPITYSVEIFNDNSRSNHKFLGGTATTNKSSSILPLSQISFQIHPVQSVQNQQHLAPTTYRQNLPHQQTQNRSPVGRPPLPPRAAQRPQIQAPQFQQNIYQQSSQESIKREIEMVDSMIFLQNDSISQHNKQYIESRIVRYKF